MNSVRLMFNITNLCLKSQNSTKNSSLIVQTLTSRVGIDFVLSFPSLRSGIVLRSMLRINQSNNRTVKSKT